MLAITAIAISRLQSLFAIVMLFGIYSSLTALLFVVLDAVDVAFTEAAVGAGISTVLMLGALAIAGHHAKQSSHRAYLPLLVVIVTGSALVWGTFDLPYFSDPSNAIHNHVAPRYIYDSPNEIGIPNMVTSVLASYRGFDTFGELVVVFTALIAVLALLGFPGVAKSRVELKKSSSTLLRIGAIWIIPFIILFALYVQFHGDFSPGGGFQAGVIFCSAFVIYTLAYGFEQSKSAINPTVFLITSAIGVLLYGGVGILSMISGGNFLDYSALLENPVSGQHLGIILIEFGVGITVASVLIIIFYCIVQAEVRQFKHRIDNPPAKITNND